MILAGSAIAQETFVVERIFAGVLENVILSKNYGAVAFTALYKKRRLIL